MIYDFATHSLYYENQRIDVPNFSLTIDTLEMVFELRTGKLIYVQGFLPLIRASKSSINFPICTKGDYLLRDFDLSKCKQNAVYDLMKKIPATQKYFERMPVKYDAEKGIIQVGEEMKALETTIEVNDNLLCGLDQKLNLKCLYIIPTRFIGKTTGL